MKPPSGEMSFAAFLTEYRGLLREYYRDPFAKASKLVIVRRRLSLPAQAVLLRCLMFDPAATKQITRLERHIRDLRDRRVLRYKHPPQPDKEAAERIRAETDARLREHERKGELFAMFLVIYEYALVETERDRNPLPYQLEAAAYRILPRVAQRYLQRIFALDYETTLAICDYEDRRRQRTTWYPTHGISIDPRSLPPRDWRGDRPPDQWH